MTAHEAYRRIRKGGREFGQRRAMQARRKPLIVEIHKSQKKVAVK